MQVETGASANCPAPTSPGGLVLVFIYKYITYICTFLQLLLYISTAQTARYGHGQKRKRARAVPRDEQRGLAEIFAMQTVGSSEGFFRPSLCVIIARYGVGCNAGFLIGLIAAGLRHPAVWLLRAPCRRCAALRCGPGVHPALGPGPDGNDQRGRGVAAWAATRRGRAPQIWS